MTQSMKRPYGITIITILAIVSGVMLIFGGLSSLVSGAFFASIPFENVMTELQQREQGQPQTLNVAEIHSLIQLLGFVPFIHAAIFIIDVIVSVHLSSNYSYEYGYKKLKAIHKYKQYF